MDKRVIIQPSSCFEFPTAKANTHHTSLIILFAWHTFPLFLLTFTQFLSVLPALAASAVCCIAFFRRTISFIRDHLIHLHTVGCPSALSYFFFPIPSLWMSPCLFEITIWLINNLYFDVLKGVSTQWFAAGVLCNNVRAIYISIREMVIAQQYLIQEALDHQHHVLFCLNLRPWGTILCFIKST